MLRKALRIDHYTPITGELSTPGGQAPGDNPEMSLSPHGSPSGGGAAVGAESALELL